MGVKKSFRFKSALVGNEWIEDVVLTVSDGVIASIVTIEEFAGPDVESVDGVALPGIANLHSHAFQRGFAGLSEYRTTKNDSFWTWRKLMYDFVWKLAPADVYVIAKQVYLEMLAAGYTFVGEFHYLHNDANGSPYPKTTEMADAVTTAALDAGIGICLLPTLYQRGGFERELQPDQRRFALDENSFLELVHSCHSKYRDEPNFQLGMAIHSLRAVDKATAQCMIEGFRNEFDDRPIHIHIAEQMAEVDECMAATGQRPIEYLFSNFDIDSHWCLIHATHAESEELNQIAESKAVVGLCPTTEANLGDGVFPADEFLQMGGRIGIGSDSHIAIGLTAELRLIEYGQRLTQKKRAILGTDAESVGRRLYRESALGGAAALGLKGGAILAGRRADLIVVDPNHPTIARAENDRLLDRLVFCEHGNPITRTMVGGNWMDAAREIDNHRSNFLEVTSRLLSE